jgi:hypothetical protein
MKVSVVETKDFIIYLEDDNGKTFIHCDVLSTWSKKVKRSLLLWFDKLTKEYGKELYALHTPNDKKHEKFLRMFNFKYLTNIEGLDGKSYDVYIWR